MIRVLLFYFVPACIWLYFVIEASMTRSPRLMPRYAWVLLTALAPGVGTLLWLVFGRARRRPTRSAAPDDDPRFLRKLDDEVWRKRLRDRRNRKEDQ